jgi:uncharacterized protein (TIGR02996 family)
MDEQAFLDVLEAHPEDDTTRLVYADWLDDHGQPEHAALLRAEVALAAMAEGQREGSSESAAACAGWSALDRTWVERVAGRWEVALIGVDFTPPQGEGPVFWKIQLIISVRRGALAIDRHMGLKATKDLVDSAPSVLLAGLPWGAAQAMKARIQAPRDEWENYLANSHPHLAGLPWRCAGTVVVRPRRLSSR